MDAQKLLNLEPHHEGGYFRRTYKSKMNVSIVGDAGTRSANDPNSEIKWHIMISIYYTCWLGRLGPIMCMNLNRSNIIHYYQLGCPVEYLIINPRDPGEVSRVPTSSQGRSFKCSSQGVNVVGGVHTYVPGLNWELALMDILLRVRPWLRSWIWLCW